MGIILCISTLIHDIDWQILADIAVVIAAILVILQVVETRKTTYAQAYGLVLDRLQNEEVRKARTKVFLLKAKPFKEWDSDDKNAAGIVCSTYDVIDQMVRAHLLPKRIIINNWGVSIRNSWPILSSYVFSLRDELKAQEYWDDYEWLAQESTKLYEHMKKKHKFKNLLSKSLRKT